MENVHVKASINISLLRKLLWFLLQPALKLLSIKHLPTFDYCDVVWNACTMDEATKLERLQNYAARSILQQRSDYSACLARRDLNHPTLTSRRKLHLAQHGFKSIPPYLKEIFSTSPSVQNHLT